MKKQTITWTALPNGMIVDPDRGGARLQLSAFVSVRLHTNESLPHPRLSQFPDFLDWPARMADAQFQVQFDNRPPVDAERVPTPAGPDPSVLWGSIFDEQTFVDPYEVEQDEQLERRVVRSFPVKNVVSHLKSAYQTLATERPTEPPRLEFEPRAPDVGDIQPFMMMLQEASPQQQQEQQLMSNVDTQLRTARFKSMANPALRAVGAGATRVAKQAPTTAPVRVPPAVSQQMLDFHQVKDFFGLLQRPEVAGLRPELRLPIVFDPIDFHEILSSLGEYPDLLRRLGLVIDLEIPFQTWMKSASWVKVAGEWTPDLAPTSNATPRTRCSVTSNDFTAVPGPDGDDMANGMLKLDDEDMFEVGQIDVDGAALKTVATAENLKQDTQEQKTGVPTLRSVGLWVAKVNRAHEFTAVKLPKLKALNTTLGQIEQTQVLRVPGRRVNPLTPGTGGGGPDLELYAEDLVRGYRIDVRDEADGQWRSLCRRDGAYQFENVSAQISVTDEGWISSAVTEPLTPDDESEETEDLRMHETLFRWDGWSLAVSRPGNPVPQQGVAEPAGNEYGLEVDFEPVAGSLPRLRYGHEYRLRARVVDLAGNSRPPDDPDDTNATEPVRYTRHDPVQSPPVIPRQNLDDSPGESVAHAVIRSLNDEPAKDDIPTDDSSERHIAPPKTTQINSEIHGMFDGPEGMRGDTATYNMIVANQGSLQEAYPGAQFDVPYLPDPVAFGVTVRFRSLQAAEEDEVTKIQFQGEWPELKSFRIRVVERTSAARQPRYDEGQRLLTIPLEKAETAEVWLSCYIDPEAMDQMGMWQWTAEGVVEPKIEEARVDKSIASQIRRDAVHVHKLPSIQRQVRLAPDVIGRIEKLNEFVIKGMHWMVTPPHKVKLVHAVQQPLVTPQFQSLRAKKQIGDTFARLSDQVPVDGNSTAKIDVMAAWEEPVDKLAEPEPRIIEGRGHVCEIAVQQGDTRADLTVPIKLAQLRGGGVRRPGGAVVRPDMEEAEIARPGIRREGVEGPPSAAIQPGMVVHPTLPRTGRKHEFGDTKYRRVRYKMVATTRFREYMPFSDEDIDEGRVQITRSSDEMAVDVLSSARPAAPKIMYVVPTFGWQRTERGDEVTSRRRGGGLRVYMERPWYSSGDGELLGVVLIQPATGGMLLTAMVPQAGGALEQYVTRWAMDPVYSGGMETRQIAPDDFPEAVATEDDLTLDELPGAKVQVAAHEVGYDPQRQLWYSDIEIASPSNYFRFVRLALARYQPNSVKTSETDCKLSRVVLADFAQLPPERAATFTMDPRAPDRVDITLRGRVARTEAGKYNEVEVTVETRRPGSEDEAGWRQVPDSTVALEHRRTRTGGAVYTGTVNLPADRGTEPMRLVIKEYELFRVESTSKLRVVVSQQRPVGRRLVYADTLEI